MSLSKNEKLAIVQAKINQLERQKYEFELNTMLYMTSDETKEATATETKIKSLEKMIVALEEELNSLMTV